MTDLKESKVVVMVIPKRTMVEINSIPCMLVGDAKVQTTVENVEKIMEKITWI